MKQATTIISRRDASTMEVNSTTLKGFDNTAFGGYSTVKRSVLLLVWAIGMLIASFSAGAQDVDDFQAGIKFEKTSVNLGDMTPDSGKQKFEFKFVNNGNAPLVLTYVHASCSCIGLDYPRTPENAEIFNLVDRAVAWLASNVITNPILTWDTPVWGEIPADFGRK